MKSYFTEDRVRAQGKAWQIRLLLSQWKKESGRDVKITDLIHFYQNSYSVKG
ncbi:Z-ring formation inhibitor MciZ [Paenibacillus barengoltzii]